MKTGSVPDPTTLNPKPDELTQRWSLRSSFISEEQRYSRCGDRRDVAGPLGGKGFRLLEAVVDAVGRCWATDSPVGQAA